MLSDLVAEQVVRLRKRAGLRRDQLADRCHELGMEELTEAALANIETGRRDKHSRKRRRRVTVDELVGLALALDVPVVSLMADPVHMRSEQVPLADGHAVGPWDALLWMSGLAWTFGDSSEPATYRAAADLIWRGYMIAEMAGNLQPKMAGGPHPAAQEDIDRVDRSYLATVQQFLGEIQKAKAVLPTVPPHVLKRAAELGVDLPGQSVEAEVRP